MLSADADVLAYRARAAQVLDANVAAIRSWATTHAAVVENAPTGGISIWTVAAAYSRASADATLLPIAEKAAASLVARRTTSLFVGGNDGWEAWAMADTYLRYRPLIDAAKGRYAPAGLAANPASGDGRYTLGELFKHVLTKSGYAPIDSTSNHVLMNATARYLAEQAFPGQVAKGYNNSTTDPTGARVIQTRAEQLVTDGPAEYLSLNYGAYNWAQFLSVHQLTTLPANAALASRAKIAFEAAFAMNAAYWMNGQLAGPVGRGYPNTGAWGASGGDALTWTFLGGDYGKAAQQRAYAASTDVKALGVLASVAQFGSGAVAAYEIPVSLLKLDDPVPKVTRSNYGTNHQYAYNAGTWSTYSESYKWDAFGPYQATWRARTIWTKPERHDYQAVAWVTNPATDPGPNADGSWTYVDPYTLRTWDLSGSGTYSGSSVFSDMVQNLSTVLQVYNIPPLAIAGTPGGKVPVRGALVYVPVPEVIATGLDAADGDGWFRPVISADAKRLFVAYEGVFMCFLSTAPISLGTRVGQKQFFNIYGGTEPGRQADANSYLQFAVAQETFSPEAFAGTTLAEKFTNFQTAMLGRELPRLVKADTHHPAWCYTDDKATLTSEFGGIVRYAKDPQNHTKGFGFDSIGGLGNTDPQIIDYSTWPLLQQIDVGGRVWAHQPEDGNLAITVPGHMPLGYDFGTWRTVTGSDVALLPAPTTRFTAPANLRFTLTATNQITLSWTNTASGTANVELQYSLDGSTQWRRLASLSAATTSRTVTYADFAGAERIFYRVRASGRGLNGTTEWSPASNVVGTEFSAAFVGGTTSMPRVLAARGSPTQIALSWVDTATNETGYQVERSADAGGSWSVLTASLPPGTTAYVDAAVTPGSSFAYRVRAVNGTARSAPSAVAVARAAAANAGPTIARAAEGVVVGTTATLAVLGADDDGEAALRYAWSVAAGPGAVHFATPPGHAAKATAATFSRAGRYRLVATVTDAQGLATASSLDVDVAQTASRIVVTPDAGPVASGGVVQVAATVLDQFGMPLASQPALTWTTTAGSIDATGRLTVPGGNGLVIVTASAGPLRQSALLPFQTSPLPLASYSFDEMVGPTARDASANGFDARLAGGVAFGSGASVRGSAGGGLVFDGSGVATIGDPPRLNITGAITLSAWVRLAGTSGIQSIIAKGYNTGSGAGEIFLRTNGAAYEVGSWNGSTSKAAATIPAGDIGQWVHLVGTYDPAAQRWALYRNGVQAAVSGTTAQGAVSVAGRGWTIGATARGDRFFTGAIDEVQIGANATTAAEALAAYQSFLGPVVTAPAAASGPAVGTTTLTARGDGPGGETALTYTWATVGPVPGPVVFPANGTNTAKTMAVTLPAAGRYQFAVIITTATGAATTSFVTLDVATLTDLVVDVPAHAMVTLAEPPGGAARLVKRGEGTLHVTRPAAFTGGTVVEAGTLVVADAAGLGAGRLEIAAQALVSLAVGHAAVSLQGLAIAAGGRLDLGTGRITVAAGGFDEAAVVGLLVAGRNGGAWNGPTGITSRAASAASRRTVGHRVAGGVLTVAWAALGDINLDGRVNSVDVSLLHASGRFNAAGTSSRWVHGDFNFDGRVNSIDVSLMMATGLFNQPSYRTGPGTIDSPPG